MTEQELMELYKLARSLPKGSLIVEVGSYLGASTVFLASGASQINGKVYAVDTWNNTAMSEGRRNTYDEFMRNTEMLQKYIVPMRGYSDHIAGSFNLKLNMLFIDGAHSYEGCYRDWESWRRHLRGGALVIFHDIGWAEGVRRIVNEEVAPIAAKEGRLPNLYWAWLK